MPNFNKVILMGHTTADIVTRYTPAGNAVSKFTLAVNDYKKDGKSTVSFIEITAFGKQAETLGSVKRGDPLFVEGKLQQDKWVDKNTGSNRYKLGVTLTTFRFLKSKGLSNNSGGSEENTGINNNDDMPF